MIEVIWMSVSGICGVWFQDYNDGIVVGMVSTWLIRGVWNVPLGMRQPLSQYYSTPYESSLGPANFPLFCLRQITALLQQFRLSELEMVETL